MGQLASFGISNLTPFSLQYQMDFHSNSTICFPDGTAMGEEKQ